MKRKLLAVFGTRPEAIKMCPLVRALQRDPRFCCEVCFSGQHREMLYEVTALFGVRAEYELFAMERESLADRQAYLLRELDRVMGESAPHLVLVHGDTLTAQTAALAAFYRRLPIGHVEAGLRTYHLDSPFPEEMNRRVIGLVAAYHFAPTERAKANLLAEGVDPRAVSVTGNTVCDALAYTAGCSGALDWPDARAVCSRLVVLTTHRRESLGEPMRQIFRAVSRLLREREDVGVVFPWHKNPAVRALALEELPRHPRLWVREPMDLVAFHALLRRADLIMTDSGGIQEEAACLGVPTLVLRHHTERQEGVEEGILTLVEPREEAIVTAALRTLDNGCVPTRERGLYGDGGASQRIVDMLARDPLGVFPPLSC